MKNEYYVYAYLDPLKEGSFNYNGLFFSNEPFYIGKGKNRRMFKHLRKARNILLSDRIDLIRSQKIEPIIVIIEEKLDELIAFSIERNIIRDIGRININTGPLVNLTNGGKGFRGCNSYRKGFTGKHSEETKNRLSEVNKGKTFIDKVGDIKAQEWRNKISESNKGQKRNFSEESLNNIRNIWLNKKMPDDIRKKMSEKRKGVSPSNKGRIVYQYSLDGEFLKELFLYEIQKEFNIPCSNVIKCCKGERKKAGGC